MEKIYNHFKLLEPNGHICGFNSELKGMYLDFFLKKKKKSILFVANSLFEANKIFRAVSNHQDNVFLFPMDDFLTSEALAISPELKITRLETLNRLINKKEPCIVITNLTGLLRFLPETSLYKDSILLLEKNKDYEMNKLLDKLYALGYQKESIVTKTGEMAARGFVIDIFPISSKDPIRIEFWGDTIDSIRYFDVDSQLTISSLENVTIFPNSELLIKEDIDLFGLRQKDLPKYGPVSTIMDYLSDGVVFYDNYDQIDISHGQLLEEMFEYSVSNNEPGTKYMHDLGIFANKESYYFSNFDNATSIDNNLAKYNTVELEFSGDTRVLEETLKKYVLSGKTVIICVSNRYKVNKLL